MRTLAPRLLPAAACLWVVLLLIAPAALTLLSDPSYAAATSTILPIEAQHATVLTIALEGGPEELFPTGAFESTALGDGTDPTKGLDTAVFG